MPDFVVHLSRIVYGVSNFIAQNPAVTLPQIVQLFFYRRFCDTQGSSEIGIRNVGALRGQLSAQGLEKPQSSLAFAFLPQTPQGMVHDRRRPAQIEGSLRRQGVESLRRDR